MIIWPQPGRDVLALRSRYGVRRALTRRMLPGVQTQLAIVLLVAIGVIACAGGPEFVVIARAPRRQRLQTWRQRRRTVPRRSPLHDDLDSLCLVQGRPARSGQTAVLPGRQTPDVRDARPGLRPDRGGAADGRAIPRRADAPGGLCRCCMHRHSPSRRVRPAPGRC